jgi:hypothetical protein
VRHADGAKITIFNLKCSLRLSPCLVFETHMTQTPWSLVVEKLIVA